MENEKLKEFWDYMSSRDYLIDDNLFVKYKELMSGKSEEDEKLCPVEYTRRDYYFSKYSIEVTRLKNDSGGYYAGLMVNITRKSDNAKEEIDNDIWLINFLTDDEEDPSDILDGYGRRLLKSVIRDLIDVGWLSIKK